MPTGGGGGMQHQPTAERMHPHVRPGAPPGHDCGLKKTDNLYEFKYLYPNQTFSKFPQQNCSFIFSPFLLDCCKIW
jgi:hypothetical protein